jgi:hypothetical protein
MCWCLRSFLYGGKTQRAASLDFPSNLNGAKSRARVFWSKTPRWVTRMLARRRETKRLRAEAEKAAAVKAKKAQEAEKAEAEDAAAAPAPSLVEAPVLENGGCYEEVGMENCSSSIGSKGRQKGSKNTGYGLHGKHFEASTREELGLEVEEYKSLHRGDGPQQGWNNPAPSAKKKPPYGHVQIHKCRAFSGYGCGAKLKVHTYYNTESGKFCADAAMSVEHDHADANEKLHKKSNVPRRDKEKILQLRSSGKLTPSKIDQVRAGHKQMNEPNIFRCIFNVLV